MAQKSIKRVLGIDPFTCGVGFAVIEEGLGLVDWGLRTTGKPDNRKAVRAAEKLIDRFQPDLLALEDWDAAGARRCERVEILLNLIANGKWEGVRVRLVSLRDIRALGPLPGVSTKYGRASFFAERFPELRAFLPPIRKPWMSEDNRMSIFDAVAFAVACLPDRGQGWPDSIPPNASETPGESADGIDG
jgi:hypothetical protein